MWNLAGDVLQIVSPRTADDDGIVRRGQQEAPAGAAEYRTRQEFGGGALSASAGTGRIHPIFIIGCGRTQLSRRMGAQRAKMKAPEQKLLWRFLSYILVDDKAPRQQLR